MNIPNVITVLRIAGVAAFAATFTAGRMRAALALFVVTALSDFFDGLLARLLRQESDLGSFLDPLADKLCIGVAVVVLSARGLLPWWLWVSVAVREAAVVAGWVWVKRRSAFGLRTTPRASGKAAAFVLMGTMAVVMLRLGMNHPVPRIVADAVTPFLFVACAILCWGSLADYLGALIRLKVRAA